MSRRNLKILQLIFLPTSLLDTSIVHTYFSQLQAACVHVVPCTEMPSCLLCSPMDALDALDALDAVQLYGAIFLNSGLNAVQWAEYGCLLQMLSN